MFTCKDFDSTDAPAEMIQYIIDNTELFDTRYQYALGVIGRDRCPIWQASPLLAAEMQDHLEDWCNDNEDNPDLYDINEIFG